MLGNSPLSETDPELYSFVQQEKERQKRGLELIASENFASRAVLDCLGSCLTNKYSEGVVGNRYYGGNEIIDKIEALCKKRALELFKLKEEEWGVNVQPYSGSTANLAAYTGILAPHERLMGLDLPSGGHLSHGYQTAKKKISSTSIFWESMPYQINKTGYIDYDRLEENSLLFRPKLIVCGGSAYCRDWDYARLRQIADKNGSFLMSDMAHISGLVATQQCNNPFDYCDVVTTTTHKTLRGPRAGIIFFRRGSKKNEKGEEIKYDLEEKINFAVFPATQGGPHQNAIGAIATALKEASTPEFREYIQRVKQNAQVMAKELLDRGYTLMTGGTDNHSLLWDLRPQGISGNNIEKLLEQSGISVNKNAVYGDVSALVPGGVRLGTSCLTTRQFSEDDFKKVVEFLDRGVKIGIEIQKKTGKPLKNFIVGVKESEEIKTLRKEVEEFASNFPMPG
jgi:glycine hydroxymethyltransferase